MKKRSLSDREGEVRELSGKALEQFRPAAEVLSGELVAMLPRRKPGQRGAQKQPTKDQITLRLDHDVVEHYKATGAGWQSRINAALRAAIKRTG